MESKGITVTHKHTLICLNWDNVDKTDNIIKHFITSTSDSANGPLTFLHIFIRDLSKKEKDNRKVTITSQ